MPQDKDFTFYVDSSEQDPNIPDVDRCPDHPNVEPEMGYGMAGGGMGAYSFCPECGKVLSKTQDHE